MKIVFVSERSLPMRCRRCRWSTSLWQRDLFSRLCARCRQIDAVQPGLDREDAAREALYAHAEASLGRGAAPAELEGQLAGCGLHPQEAASVVRDLVARREPYVRATELLDGGASRDETHRRLVETGLDPGVATWVIDEVQRARSGEAAAREGSGLTAVGAVVFFVGLGLMFGNITGLFPTFPFAGFLTTGLGSLLMSVGQGRS